ncbi:MAG: right-handed parallel beta-helix repeat-containing protein [Fibrobacteria bacterium]|nr:right-handed parallel beta-helix repeat-containing protein [Fibrobacteria bacterium]
MTTSPTRLALLPVLFAASLAVSRDIYFDARFFSADADGTIDKPWQTLDHCFRDALPGDVCLLKPGKYNLATPSGGSLGRVEHSGTVQSPIVVKSIVPNSVVIGAWHSLSWVQSTRPGIWEGSMAPLSASLEALQGVWSGIQNMDGVQLWDTLHTNRFRQATWPYAELGPFPQTANLQAGSTPGAYELYNLPSGSLAGAKAHLFRNNEQGALVRTVSSRSSGNTLTMENSGYADEVFTGTRVWLSGHPNLLRAEDQGRWTRDPATGKILLASQKSPYLMDLALQVSSIGPNLSGRSWWTFEGIIFQGITPITDAASMGLHLRSVRFVGTGLHDGVRAYSAGTPLRIGLVLEGSSHLVERSLFTECATTCVEVIGSDIEIYNNVFLYSQFRGTAYAGAVHVLGADNSIRNNYLAEMGGTGVMVGNGPRTRVSRNRIQGWGRLSASLAGGISAFGPSSYSIEIDSNFIFEERRLTPELTDPWPSGAINLINSRNKALIHHNVIDRAKVGIRFGGVFGSPGDGSNDNLVYSNTIGDGVQYSWLRATSNSYPFGGSFLRNNIFRTVAGNLYGYHGRDIQPTDPTTSFAGGTADHNLSHQIHPVWADPTHDQDNYEIAATSPAVDAGIVYNLPRGQVEFRGAAPDLGAIEQGTRFGTGLVDPDPPVVGGPLSMDNLADWHTFAGGVTVSSTQNKTEGAAAISLSSTGYYLVSSRPMDHTEIEALGAISIDIFVPVEQANPFWVGGLHFLLYCPSRNVFSGHVGYIELTNAPRGVWQRYWLPIPEYISSSLVPPFYDFSLTIGVNGSPGSGAYVVDNIRFER